jgi:hypothetical protein
MSSEVGTLPKLKEDALIAAIVGYFKAWEFFLFRRIPSMQSGEEAKKHTTAVKRLQDLVAEMLILSSNSTDPNAKKVEIITDIKESCKSTSTPIFVQKLLDMFKRGEISKDMMEQCALEMLLAGTDTSSVTLFYTIMKLAEGMHEDSLQDQLYVDIMKRRCQLLAPIQEAKCRNWRGEIIHCMESAHDADEWLEHLDTIRFELNHLIGHQSSLAEAITKETLRTKPVGPVVIRRAIEADSFIDGSGKTFTVDKGTGVIIHLALMHQNPSVFPDPEKFNPNRFLDRSAASTELLNASFFPFGKGLKGCIGQHLGMAEVRSVLVTLLSAYRFRLEDRDLTLEGLQTKWEIANQPSKTPNIIFWRRRIPVVITGAHSTGKTTLCDQLLELKVSHGLKIHSDD